MVPPALATIASALLGMEPPLKATRNDWLDGLEVSAPVVSVTGSTDASPHPANENPTNTTTNNDDDRIGLHMVVSSNVKGIRGYTRPTRCRTTNLEKVGARRFRNGCYEIASARVTTLTSDGRSQTKTPKRLGLPAEHEKSPRASRVASGVTMSAWRSV